MKDHLISSARERLLAGITVVGECLEFRHAPKREGYGQLWFCGRQTTAPRVAWIVFYGEIPSGLWVLHKCDNPPCVRLDHLYLGTHADNTRDMVERKRAGHKGGRSPKLTPEQITVIRSTPRGKRRAYTRELAQRFGVSRATISRACLGVQTYEGC